MIVVPKAQWLGLVRDLETVEGRASLGNVIFAEFKSHQQLTSTHLQLPIPATPEVTMAKVRQQVPRPTYHTSSTYADIPIDARKTRRMLYNKIKYGVARE